MQDNQPKHRQRDREARKLERKQGSRVGYPTALIVCEGEKTEPNYLRGLLQHLRVNSANARVVAGGEETTPDLVVRRAQKLFQLEPEFDRAFAVVDADQPMEQAISLAQKQLKRKDGKHISVEIIASAPCFEFWLLLHFEYTTRTFGSCPEVVSELRAYVPNYSKASPQLFAQVAGGDRLAQAESNALRLKADLQRQGLTVPDTDMASLVSVLGGMARR